MGDTELPAALRARAPCLLQDMGDLCPHPVTRFSPHPSFSPEVSLCHEDPLFTALWWAELRYCSMFNQCP